MKSIFDKVSNQVKEKNIGIASSQFKGEVVNVHVQNKGVRSFKIERK